MARKQAIHPKTSPLRPLKHVRWPRKINRNPGNEFLLKIHKLNPRKMAKVIKHLKWPNVSPDHRQPIQKHIDPHWLDIHCKRRLNKKFRRRNFSKTEKNETGLPTQAWNSTKIIRIVTKEIWARNPRLEGKNSNSVKTNLSKPNFDRRQPDGNRASNELRRQIWVP